MKNKTLICLILDRSGSMSGKETDVVHSVNKFISEQRTNKENALIAMYRFDDVIEKFRPLVKLQEITELSLDDYRPRGWTSLNDAIGRGLVSTERDMVKHNCTKALMIIVTDGYENSSKLYTRSQIKTLIEEKRKTGNWEFVYLGANVDAFTESASIGIPQFTSAGFTTTKGGLRSLGATISATVSNYTASASTQGSGLGVANLGEKDDKSSAT